MIGEKYIQGNLANPAAQVRSASDKILARLDDPALQTGTQAAERRQLIRRELDQRVDWSFRVRRGRAWAASFGTSSTRFTS